MRRCSPICKKPIDSQVRQFVAAVLIVKGYANMCEMVIENGELKEYKGTEAVISVPEGVHTIGCGAFADHKDIRFIALPEGLKEIAGYAFDGCANLRHIHIPDSVEFIDDGAFENCVLLEHIEADGENYVSVDGILYNADQTILLRYPPARAGNRFSVPDNVAEIASGAFQASQHLAEIHLPNSVTVSDVGDDAFEACPVLDTVVFHMM